VVKELQKGNTTLYVCEECGYAYEEKEWAEKCQAWCGEHQSCNLEIIQHGAPLEVD
jgi:rubrerythrin